MCQKLLRRKQIRMVEFILLNLDPPARCAPEPHGLLIKKHQKAKGKSKSARVPPGDWLTNFNIPQIRKHCQNLFRINITKQQKS